MMKLKRVSWMSCFDCLNLCLNVKLILITLNPNRISSSCWIRGGIATEAIKGNSIQEGQDPILSLRVKPSLIACLSLCPNSLLSTVAIQPTSGSNLNVSEGGSWLAVRSVI